MVEGLQAAGVWDDTILLFTADHGEEFFEEGRYGHNSSLNHYQTQVPFVLHLPGMEPRRIQRLTSHTDAIGAILSALGAPEDFLANVQGHDLFAMEEKP
ncbi:sulfatase-like hydrolase/transferase, partial [Arthrospira platensis SPKY1]|nr:sulfatase-like hydrolase/transferase [Arthrospira platensis SPKY1]